EHVDSLCKRPPSIAHTDSRDFVRQYTGAYDTHLHARLVLARCSDDVHAEMGQGTGRSFKESRMISAGWQGGFKELPWVRHLYGKGGSVRAQDRHF
ncbi:MAG: hypothetical protein ACPIOQ_47900, partial [Promethearchaeia archaeon]